MFVFNDINRHVGNLHRLFCPHCDAYKPLLGYKSYSTFRTVDDPRKGGKKV